MLKPVFFINVPVPVIYIIKYNFNKIGNGLIILKYDVVGIIIHDCNNIK